MPIQPLGNSSSIWLFNDSIRRGGRDSGPGPLAKLFGIERAPLAVTDPTSDPNGPLAQLFAIAADYAAPARGLSKEDAKDPLALLNFLANLGRPTVRQNNLFGSFSPENDPLNAPSRILSGFFAPQEELLADVIFTLDTYG